MVELACASIVMRNSRVSAIFPSLRAIAADKNGCKVEIMAGNEF